MILSKQTKNYLFIFAILCLLLNATKIRADLGETYEDPDGKFILHYTSSSTEPTNMVTRLQVEEFSDHLDDMRQRTLDAGFRDPGEPHHVDIFAQGKNAHAGCRGMNFDPYYLGNPSLGTVSPTEKKLVPLHELMHTTQFCTPQSELTQGSGAWIHEGQARMIQDKYFNDIDQENGTDFASYLGQVKAYLGNPDRPLFDLSYDGALFWTYVAEHYGSRVGEPDLGLDAIVEYWNTVESLHEQETYTIYQVFDIMLNNLGYPYVTFDDVYKDFIVANYARLLDRSSTPEKYLYADETQDPGSYGDLSFNAEYNMINKTTDGGTFNVLEYEPNYFRITKAEPVSLVNVHVNQVSRNYLFYSVLVIKDNELVDEYRTVSVDLDHTVTRDFDEIIVLVSGLRHTDLRIANYRLFVSTGGPSTFLNIVYPTTENSVNLGSTTNTNNFVAIVEVFDGKEPVTGLTRSDFTSSSYNFPLLSVTYANGLYFLEHGASISRSGRYDYSIRLRENYQASDFEEDAVGVNDAGFDFNYNYMVVIDKSISMNSFEKLAAAKSAAKLFVNSINDRHDLGVVEFGTNANLRQPLVDLGPNRGTIINSIDTISATSFSTSVGDGLYEALNTIVEKINNDPSPSLNEYKKIIVLTDGKENAAKYINDVAGQIIDNRTHLYAVILGADAEGDTLSSLAERTVVGASFYALEPASGTLAVDLAKIYRSIYEKDNNKHNIFTKTNALNSSLWAVDDIIHVPVKQNVSFAYSFRGNTNPVVYLQHPNGSLLGASFTNSKLDGIGFYGHKVWNLPFAEAGDYHFLIPEGKDYLEFYIGASGTQNINLNLHLGLSGYDRAIGNVLPITATLSDGKGVITQGTINGTITAGNNYHESYSWNITLYDDGNNGDGDPNDGVYGGYFGATSIYNYTTLTGGYIASFQATGITNLGEPFSVTASDSIFLVMRGDKDQDYLPDIWEIRNGLDPNSNKGDDGATGDPDLDGLQNYYEFFWGSNAQSSDTDGGGEGDRRELGRHNPLDPNDDVMGAPFISAKAGSNNVTIQFTLDGKYTLVGIYRSQAGVSGFSPIETSVDPNLVSSWVDTNAVNGETYYYKVLALNGSSTLSSYSNIVEVTPKEKLTLPLGSASIVGNVRYSVSRTVSFNLYFSDDTDEIEIADNPRFADPTIITPRNTFSYTFSDDGFQYLYIKFIDAYNNSGGFHNSDYSFVGVYIGNPSVTSSSSNSSTTDGGSSEGLYYDIGGISFLFITLSIYRIRKKK